MDDDERKLFNAHMKEAEKLAEKHLTEMMEACGHDKRLAAFAVGRLTMFAFVATRTIMGDAGCEALLRDMYLQLDTPRTPKNEH